jgi:hypothetical protein
MAAEPPLTCPSCATPHPGDERFCHACGLPLVRADRPHRDLVVSAAHARARKVKPQYAEGDLVRVAGSRNQAEAELIQGMLLEEGVPSLLRRSRGFDVPDMLAAGPRDVLVPRSGLDAAREILLQADMLAVGGPGPQASRVLLVLLAMVLVTGLVAWLGTVLLA